MTKPPWFDRLGGRKFFFAVLVLSICTGALALRLIDGSQFAMLVGGAMAMFGVGNVMVERTVTARNSTATPRPAVPDEDPKPPRPGVGPA